VFTQVTDPVGEGLVLNLAHPGGHLTGFTSFEFSIGTKSPSNMLVWPVLANVSKVVSPSTSS
jgi:putative ABC transport system substrate-binding protein